MADDKAGRDKQAHDEANRQRAREVEAELERGDEPEPPVKSEPAVELETLTELEQDLSSIEFPATGTEVVAAVGDREIASAEGTYAVADLVPDTDEETFDAPDAVRVQVERPAVASAMKRIVEAVGTLRNAEFRPSQRDAYVKTFEELAAIGADDDEGIAAVADWVVERIDEKGTVPGSRDVRRRAAKFCRENGVRVRNDEWLGI